MTNFGEAVQKGLNVHKRAEEARREMSEVLVTASRDVSAVLETTVSFQLERVDRPSRMLTPGEALGFLPAPRKEFEALTVRHNRSSFKVLAEANIGAIGYPVSLRWDNEFRTAEDHEGFEAMIKDLLENGSTGAKIEALLQGK